MNSAPSLKCPKCATLLDGVTAVQGQYWSCRSCLGSLLGSTILLKMSSRDLLGKIWEASAQEGKQGKKSCPQCTQGMVEFYCSPNDIWVELDLCNNCYLIWFDHDELQRIPELRTEEIRPPTAEEVDAQNAFRKKQLAPETVQFMQTVVAFFGAMIKASDDVDQAKGP